MVSYESQEYFDEINDPEFEGYPEPTYTDEELKMLAQMVWGEDRGQDPEEQALVIWTAFQQVDAGGDFAKYNTLYDVITKRDNFAGYRKGNPIDPEIYELCAAEAAKWWHGVDPPTHGIYAPTVPYLFFSGRDGHNWFRRDWR
jgi:hypothetical protein